MPITHFKGNRSPSITDTITVNGLPFNLTGSTVKFQMRAENSSTLKVDAVAQITNPPGTDGQVHYDWAAADVDTTGRWLFWWHVILPSTFIQDTSESLITIIDHVPVTRALCTLEDIQAYIPGYIPFSDRSTDTILQELLEGVSVEMQQTRMQREVMPVTANPSDKAFDLGYFEARERRVFIGDLADTTSLVVTIAELSGSSSQTVNYTDGTIVALPRNRQSYEPYNELWFPLEKTNAPTLLPGNVVTVHGDWGFPSVPPDIRLAAVKLTIIRYLNDVTKGGTAFADAVVDANFRLDMAYASAQETIDGYRFNYIGASSSPKLAGSWSHL